MEHSVRKKKKTNCAEIMGLDFLTPEGFGTLSTTKNTSGARKDEIIAPEPANGEKMTKLKKSLLA